MDYGLGNFTDFGFANSNFTNFDESEFARDLNDSVETTVLEYFFAFAFLAAIIGNSLVCFLVVKTSSMRRPINCLLMNLAVADVLLATSDGLFNLTHISGSWIFGKILCGAAFFVMAVCTNVSSLTIAIPFVVLTFRMKFSKQNCLMTIAVSWIVAAIAASPHLFQYDVYEYPGENLCLVVGNSRDFLIYNLVTEWTPCLLPIVIASAALPKWMKSRSQGTQPMLANVLIFVALWTPFVIIRSINDTFESIQLITTTYCITLIATFCKPFIYFCFVNEFNREVKKLAACRATTNDEALPMYENA